MRRSIAETLLSALERPCPAFASGEVDKARREVRAMLAVGPRLTLKSAAGSRASLDVEGGRRMNLVAFSGGKDSTALALRLAEMGETFTLLFTPTGDEFPEVTEHVERVQRVTGMPLVTPPGPTLAKVIETQGILPNHRMRWCTRMCKIEPCIAFLRQHPGSTLAVGLRADEEERTGLYGEHATYRYPLREWGWGLREVKDYLRCRGMKIPWRTNCAVCFWARADEQWRTWREYPEMWARGERWEAETGHTFRWGASMREKREWFEKGGRPRKLMRSLPLFPESEEEIGECRVCSL